MVSSSQVFEGDEVRTGWREMGVGGGQRVEKNANVEGGFNR